MKNIQWHIGCSGFHYKEWKEIFYPKGLPAARWFSYYATQFDTLEINNTFYRFPEIKLFENWYQKAPAQFRFAVKVPGEITHEKQFTGTEVLMRDFYRIAEEGLKEKLGSILFQLPPKFQYSVSRLQDILKQIDIRFNNVIEFRHISWWRKEVMEMLKQHHVSFCGVSFPGLINDAVSTANYCYYRFHGVPKLYYSSYEIDFLQKIVEQIKLAAPETAYLYFNNTAAGAAIENARQLLQLIR